MGNFLIIGGSSGIGKALTRILAAENNWVFATYNASPVESDHPKISYHAVNVLEESIDLDFLPEQLDGLAYCPGRIELKPFHRLSVKSFMDDYRLQVAGAIRVLQLALPHLKRSSSAAVLLFSTVAVQTGFPLHAQVASSKGALEGLTKALAAEWAPAIRVNAIAPSLCDTPLAARLLNTPDKREANAQRHPLKKIGTASDIASMAAFLLSESSSWITGQILPVDGGISAIR
ncbi:MAG TPA: SDR family oxidoreductase [Saprospiraceae bacterium]|nr:SDR family oxidoreductase [Saprospiraceae bacterium]